MSDTLKSCFNSTHNSLHWFTFIEALCDINGISDTINGIEISVEVSDFLDNRNIISKQNRANIRNLASSFASAGYLCPIFHFALFLHQWSNKNEGSVAYNTFLDTVKDIEVCSKKLDEVCADAVEYYLKKKDSEYDSEYEADLTDVYHREFFIFSEFVREKLLCKTEFDEKTMIEISNQSVNNHYSLFKDKAPFGLIMAGFCSCYLDTDYRGTDNNSTEPSVTAQVMTKYLLPYLTHMCENNSKQKYLKIIAKYIFRRYLDYLFNESKRYHRIPNYKGEDSSEFENSFLNDVTAKKHLDYFKCICDGLGEAGYNFLCCADTDNFKAMLPEIDYRLDALVQATVYSLYVENRVEYAGKVILKWFPKINITAQGFPVFQRISAMCFVESQDFVHANNMYCYIETLYNHYATHENVQRAFPVTVMCALTDIRDKLLFNEFLKLKKSNDKIKEMAEKEGLSDEEVIKMIEDTDVYKNILKIVKRSFMPPRNILENRVFKKRNSFFEKIGITNPEPYGSRMTEADSNMILDYLAEHESVLNYLEKCEKDPDNKKVIDFAPALIEITKAFEFVLNIIFRKLSLNISVFDGVRDNLSKAKNYFIDVNIDETENKLIGRRKSHIEIGKFANLFYPKSINSNTNLLFDAWNGANVLDISKLKGLCSIDIATGNGTKHFSRTNDNDNKKLLGDAIMYVGTNYRNKAAHKDPVPKVLYEDAKKLLMSTECLLWIIMYILK